MRTEIDSPRNEDAAQAPAFDQLFLTQYAGLVRLAYRVTGDSGRAEEIGAEALWRLHQKHPAGTDGAGAWLRRTALHLAFDSLRGQKRRSQYEARAPEPDPVLNPEEDLQRRQRRERVRSTLAALKSRDAELLVLRSEGYTHHEMALVLGLKAGSIGVFLSRADEAFRKEFVKRYGTC